MLILWLFMKVNLFWNWMYIDVLLGSGVLVMKCRLDGFVVLMMCMLLLFVW